MTYAERMIQTSPKQSSVDAAALADCIKACFDCAQACTACADACLGEQNPAMLARCIGLNVQCADICDGTGRLLSRQVQFEPTLARAVVQVCAQACRLCGDECAQHAQHGMEHCRLCADSCRRCEESCNRLLSAITA